MTNSRALSAFTTLFLAFGCSSSSPFRNPAQADSPIVLGRVSTPERDAFFDQTKLYYVRIKGWDTRYMTPQSLRDTRTTLGATFEIYQADARSGAHCPDLETSDAKLVWRTQDFELNTSGNQTNGTPKSSYKVSFTKDAAKLLGMGAVNLKSMWNDVSQMREAIVWKIFKEAEVPSPGHSYAKFCINDKYYGVYSLIEQVDKSFVKARFPAIVDNDGDQKTGNLYKGQWAARDLNSAELTWHAPFANSNSPSGKSLYWREKNIDDRTYQLKTNESKDKYNTYEDLALFIDTLNGRHLSHANARNGERDYDIPATELNTPEYASQMESLMDVKEFLRWAAVNTLVGAWDNYWMTPSNFYLYNSGRGGEDARKFMKKPYFTWIPWDYDNSLGIGMSGLQFSDSDFVDWEKSARRPGHQSRLPLLRNLLKNEKFLKYYLDFTEHLLDTSFEPEHIDALIEAYWNQIEKGAFLEADSGNAAPHTGRQFTNDQVWFNGYKGLYLDGPSGRIYGIQDFVRKRSESVRRQLKAWRSQYPSGSSGESFGEAN